MTKDEALKLALEALENLDGIDTETECVTIDVGEEITAIKEALADQQEPVAVYVGETWCGSVVRLYEELPLETPLYTSPQAQPAQQQEPVAWLWELTGEVTTDPDRADGMWLPLYTSPPTSKPWVGLTEQEHTDIAVECGCISADWVFYGATVERKLKGKNS